MIEKDKVVAICTICKHEEQMYEFFWNGKNKCLECDGDLRRLGEVNPVTAKLMEMVRKNE